MQKRQRALFCSMQTAPPPAEPIVALVGGGSWATALAELITENGFALHWWLRSETDVAHIRRTGRNPSYLPEAKVERSRLTVSTDLAAVVAPAQLVICCVPAAYLHDALAQLPADAFVGKTVGSAIKGIEVTTGLRIAEFFAHTWQVKPEQYVVITGPSHAEEVARTQTTFLTCGSAAAESAQLAASVLNADHLHTVISDDVVGLEYAGVMKNIYAVGIGLCLGLGYGDNFVAVTVANCLREMDRFLHEIAPQPPHGQRHVADSAYLGDLLVTGYSSHSRNRTLGRLVGEGMAPPQALAHMNMVAEGYYASQQIARKYTAQQLPTAHAVYRVLHEGADPAETFRTLLASFR